MDLRVIRNTLTGKSTIGSLLIDGARHCFTLEDCVRDGPKIPGQTAIPEGRYQVVIDFSARFQRLMPHILDVPGFTGIRIHKGNTDQDTEGCILLGMHKGKDRIWDCESAFHPFFDKLTEALKTEQVFIGITHEENAA
jgi:hypothetical protein